MIEINKNELKIGMKFKNKKVLCEFIGIEYDSKHNKRLDKKISYFCDFEKIGHREIIITKVYDGSGYKPRTTKHIYNIGDVLSVNNGQITIVKKIRYGNKNSRG